MKLYFDPNNKSHLEIKERMESMTLAFKTEVRQEDSPNLEDGRDTYTGEAKIIAHLDEIAGELHNWYFCKC